MDDEKKDDMPMNEEQTAEKKKGRGTGLIKITSSEMAREYQRRGAKKQAESRKRNIQFRNYLRMWADTKLNDQEKQIMEKCEAKLNEEYFIDVDDKTTREALLLIPIIQKAQKGDLRAWELVQTYLGNDRRYEMEIEQLKEENKRLRLEQEKLKADIGMNEEDKIEVSNDVPSV